MGVSQSKPGGSAGAVGQKGAEAWDDDECAAVSLGPLPRISKTPTVHESRDQDSCYYTSESFPTELPTELLERPERPSRLSLKKTTFSFDSHLSNPPKSFASQVLHPRAHNLDLQVDYEHLPEHRPRFSPTYTASPRKSLGRTPFKFDSVVSTKSSKGSRIDDNTTRRGKAVGQLPDIQVKELGFASSSFAPVQNPQGATAGSQIRTDSLAERFERLKLGKQARPPAPAVSHLRSSPMQMLPPGSIKRRDPSNATSEAKSLVKTEPSLQHQELQKRNKNATMDAEVSLSPQRSDNDAKQSVPSRNPQSQRLNEQRSAYQNAIIGQSLSCIPNRRRSRSPLQPDRRLQEFRTPRIGESLHANRRHSRSTLHPKRNLEATRQSSEVNDVSYPDIKRRAALAEIRSESPTLHGKPVSSSQQTNNLPPANLESLDQAGKEKFHPNQERVFRHATRAQIDQLRRPLQNQPSTDARSQYLISRGTADDPIELDSDSESAELSPRIIGETAEAWDQSNVEYHIRRQAQFDELQRQCDEDAKIAKRLQEEEDMRGRTMSTRDCAVCGESILISEFPSLAHCVHVPETCSNCFASWIASELMAKGWQHISCPGSDCRVNLSHAEVQQYATREVFQQFDAFSMRAVLNNDENFRWCQAKGCNSGQIHLNGEDGNIFRCVACGHRMCVIHQKTWHEGETCEEYDYRASGKKESDQKKQEEASRAAIGKFTKKCPGQNCAYNIEKNHGCDHMTCSRCRHEFCYECLADYNKIRKVGNLAHKNSCKYHSSRIQI